MTDDERYVILKVISDPRKNWHWYSVEISLGIMNAVGIQKLPALARELEAEGFLTIEPGQKEGFPHYVITPKGRQYLAEQGDRPIPEYMIWPGPEQSVDEP